MLSFIFQNIIFIILNLFHNFTFVECGQYFLEVLHTFSPISMNSKVKYVFKHTVINTDVLLKYA